ncbi:MAG TPA: hypothetical protein VLI06_20120 [Solimonas sp.]|nr:hypothetical protein [Solimonas sp.]
MADRLNLLLSVLSGGGRTSRYGDFVVVTLPAQAFVTTSQEYLQAQTWARARASMGNAQRDRSAFVDRFETVLARNGCGIATKGSRPALARLVKGMKQGGMQIEDWAVPQNINDSVEIKKRDPAPPPTDS